MSDRALEAASKASRALTARLRNAGVVAGAAALVMRSPATVGME